MPPSGSYISGNLQDALEAIILVRREGNVQAIPGPLAFFAQSKEPVMTIHSRTGTESNRRDTDYKVNLPTTTPRVQVQLRPRMALRLQPRHPANRQEPPTSQANDSKSSELQWRNRGVEPSTRRRKPTYPEAHVQCIQHPGTHSANKER